MTSKPLSYEGLKCVLQHMEANKRLQIALFCPSIRTAERVAPLKIAQLELQAGIIKLNQVTYQIGIYKNYRVGEAPEVFRILNDQGGVMYEVDKFGIEDRTVHLTPGDIDLGREPRNVNEENADQLERIIFQLELLQQIVWSLGGNQANAIVEMIKQKQAWLVPLQYQRDNAPVPFENLVQLTVKAAGKVYFEWYQHTKKFHEAMKQLGEFMFGRRPGAIHVKTFSVTKGIIRLPPGVQFHVKGIRLLDSITSTCKALEPIIFASSYPLDHLYVSIFTDQERSHPVVEGSKMLSFIYLPAAPVVAAVLNVTHPRVHINNDYQHFTPAAFLVIVQHWILLGRNCGMHHTIGFKNETTPMHWLALVKTQFNKVSFGERFVVVGMSTGLRMRITVMENYEGDQQGWMLQMLVENPSQL